MFLPAKVSFNAIKRGFEVTGSGLRAGEGCFRLIRAFEGLRIAAYVCPGGIVTIGYGHTGDDVMEGQTIDVDRAEELLALDVLRFETAVNELVMVPMTQGMMDALISFAFNLGVQALKGSTLLKKLNADDKEGAANEFLKWNKARGKVLGGLVRRRMAEREIFLS